MNGVETALFWSDDKKEDCCASWTAISSHDDTRINPMTDSKVDVTGDTTRSINSSVETMRMIPTRRPIDSPRLRVWRFRQTMFTRVERSLDSDDDDGSFLGLG
jgi:hypothetical protein